MADRSNRNLKVILILRLASVKTPPCKQSKNSVVFKSEPTLLTLGLSRHLINSISTFRSVEYSIKRLGWSEILVWGLLGTFDSNRK